MRKLRRKLTARLRSRKGESIGEVLIALLIAALALTMLASVIHSSTTMITKNKAVMGAYYDANDTLAKKNGTANGGTKTLSLVKAVGGAPTTDRVNLQISTAPSVDCFLNQNVSSKTVISYRLNG